MMSFEINSVYCPKCDESYDLEYAHIIEEGEGMKRQTLRGGMFILSWRCPECENIYNFSFDGPEETEDL